MMFGGEEEDRTPDLCIANAALSQLSYFPKWPLPVGARFWLIEACILLRNKAIGNVLVFHAIFLYCAQNYTF